MGKKTKCPSIYEWVKKTWHMYTMDISYQTKNEVMPFTATWMDLEIVILSEVCYMLTSKTNAICYHF